MGVLKKEVERIMKILKKCPKTVTGKHFFEETTIKVEEKGTRNSNPKRGFLGFGAYDRWEEVKDYYYLPVCSECGLIDDREKPKIEEVIIHGNSAPQM